MSILSYATTTFNGHQQSSLGNTRRITTSSAHASKARRWSEKAGVDAVPQGMHEFDMKDLAVES